MLAAGGSADLPAREQRWPRLGRTVAAAAALLLVAALGAAAVAASQRRRPAPNALAQKWSWPGMDSNEDGAASGVSSDGGDGDDEGGSHSSHHGHHDHHAASHHHTHRTTDRTSIEGPTTTTLTSTVTTETTTSLTTTTMTYTTTTGTTTTVTSSTSTTTTTPRRYVSLFCFTVISTTNYEVDLLRVQVEKGIGITACEDYLVFSDVKTWLSAGPTFMGRQPKVLVETEVVPINVSGKTQVSSQSLEAAWLNTENFIQVWERIIHHGGYRHHDWTVKVDPDAVFMPARLRAHLGTAPDVPLNGTVYFRNCMHDHRKCFLRLKLSRTYGDAWETEELAGTSGDTFHIEGCDATHGDGPVCIQHNWGKGVNVVKNQNGAPVAYGNCCKEGNAVVHINKRCVQKPHHAPGVKETRMNGALEVISRKAVELYGRESHRCIAAKKVGVDWTGWGEDYFMQWCLGFLGATNVEAPKLLSDSFCGAKPGDCGGGASAFHPFKDVESYLACVSKLLLDVTVPEMHSDLLNVGP